MAHKIAGGEVAEKITLRHDRRIACNSIAVDSHAPVAASTERGAKEFACGTNMLEHLDRIRLGLLSGGIPRQTLQRLAAELNATRSATADPRLRAIIDEIDLRARVEIAKYDRGG